MPATIESAVQANRVFPVAGAVDESTAAIAEMRQDEREAQVIYVLEELKKVTAEAKRLYEIKDQLAESLFGEFGMKPGDVVSLPSGDKVTFVDNFDGKNIAWGHCGVRRFDIKFK